MYQETTMIQVLSLKKEVEVVTSQKVEFNESEVIINWLIVHHLVRELINNVNLKE